MAQPARLWLTSCFALTLAVACGDDSKSHAENSASETGDGDGDPGDGDGEPGDGDGEPGDGDGDGDGDGEPKPDHYEVGFDVTELTPTELEISEDFYLGGYGLFTARGPADGVHDPMYVRSMAVGYGPDDGAIFAIVDTVGIGNKWNRRIRADVAAATGLSEEQIILGSTHTHAGPDLQGLWGGVPEPYRERIIEAMTASMVAAWQGRIPAELQASSTTADNRNRRGWGYTDDELFVLQARDLDGALLGTLVSFAAHPVVLGMDNLLVSRDFCGYAVDDLEAQLDAPVLLFNGVQGDVSPKVPDGTYADDFERAAAYGDHIATRTMLAIAEVEPVAVDFWRGYADLPLDVTNDLFLFAAQAGILDYDFTMRGGVSMVDTQTAYFRFGAEVQIIAFPGESLTRNGLPVKDAMSAPHKAILGLSGDSLGYFVPSDEWNTGLNNDYEESVSVGMAAGDQTRDAMIGMIEHDPGL
jgi:hypothetical protein